MLKFSKLQQDMILAARSAFNARMATMAANSAGVIEGNSLAIPLDAWRRIDSRAQLLARSRLPIFNRLAQASTIPVSIADLVNFYPRIGDSGEVLVSMDGRNAAKADAPALDYAGTPVPILTSNALTAANSKLAALELAANAAQDAELTALATELAANTSLKPEDFKAMGLDRCKELKANAKAAPIVPGTPAANAAADEFAGYDLNKLEA